MNKILLIIIFFVAVGCSNKQNKYEISEKVINYKISKQDSLIAIMSNTVKPLKERDWVAQYSSYIKKANPEFKLDTSKESTL